MDDSLVIIIDQWQWLNDGRVPRREFLPDLPLRIIDFINSNKIHTTVLASYNCHVDIYSNTVWYRNRLSLDDFIEYQPTLDDQKTIDILLNYINPNTWQIAMRNQKELEVYLSLHPEITNIYIVGSAWEICVKDRDLGYENVYKLFVKGTNRRLLTSLDCVESIKGGAPIPGKDWVHIVDKTYQYCPD